VHLGAAVAPTQFKPSVPRPVDFDTFWETKLQYLSITPMNALIAPVATTQAGVELSTVQVDALGSRVHGYLAKPVKLGKFPALIIYQDRNRPRGRRLARV
jgi:cephalosporin-C deacetylase-like acetyl esterase